MVAHSSRREEMVEDGGAGGVEIGREPVPVVAGNPGLGGGGGKVVLHREPFRCPR